MTNLIHTIGRGTLFQSLSNSASRIVGLVVVFVILKNLSVYEYGLVELVMSLPALLSIFALPGMSSTIIADLGILHAQGKHSEAARLHVNFFRLQIFLSFFPFLFVFFGATLIAHFYNEGIADMVRIVSFLFLIGPFRTRVVVANQVFRRFRTTAVYAVTEEVIKLCTILCGFYFFELGAKAVILSYVLCESLPIALYYGQYRSTTLPWAGADIRWQWNEILSPLRAHALWGLATSYLNTFSNNIRLWIIKFLLGTEAVGLFGVAMGLYQHTMSLVPLSSILSSLLPQFTEKKDQFLRLINKGIKYQVLSYVGMSVLGVSIISFVVGYLFPNYRAAIPLYNVMLCALVLSGFAVIFTPIFAALREQRALFWVTFIKTCSIVFLAPPLIYFFGILGIGIEFTLTIGVFVFERYRAIRKLIPEFQLSPRLFIHFDDDDRLVFRAVSQRFMK